MSNILILTSHVGFGHKSVANSIQQQLQISYPKLTTVIENPFDHPKVSKLINRTQKDYDYFVKRWPQLYSLGYQTMDRRLTAELLKDSNIILFHRAVSEIIKDTKPSLIVNTYPVFHPAIHTTFLRHRSLKVPVITTVTDLSHVHQLWFHRVSSAVIVASENIRKKAIHHKINPQIIHKFGIPVDPSITTPQNTKNIRSSFDYNPNLTTLFVVGSPRVKNLSSILELLNHSGLPLQFLITSGGNHNFHQELKSIDWHHPCLIREMLQANEMAEFLQLSDIVISKAGGIIITESLAAGKPLILTQAIHGQETGNVTYVQKHQVGEFALEPEVVQKTIFSWLEDDKELLKEITLNAQKIGKPRASEKTAKLIHKLINH